MKKVAVVVLSYDNAIKYADFLYPSLMSQTFTDFDIFLFDNHSTNHVGKQIKAKYPQINIIRIKKNKGIGHALNYAVRLLNYSFIALLNDDVYVNETFLESLVNSMQRSEKIALVNPKILFWDEPDYINAAGVTMSFFGIGFHNEIFEKNVDNRIAERYVGAAQGAAMFTRRDLYLEIGGMDESYKFGGEDLDFSWRTWLKGYRILYCPKAILYHKIGVSIAEFIEFEREFELIKNKLTTTLKNSNFLHLFFYSIISLLIDFYSLKRSPKIKTKAIISAYKKILNSIDYILKQRRKIQEGRKRADNQMVRHGFFLNIFDILRLVYSRTSKNSTKKDDLAKKFVYLPV